MATSERARRGALAKAGGCASPPADSAARAGRGRGRVRLAAAKTRFRLDPPARLGWLSVRDLAGTMRDR